MAENHVISRKMHKKHRKTKVFDFFEGVMEVLLSILEIIFTLLNPFKWFD